MTDKPTQPSQTSLLSVFEGLKGIDDARDVQARQKTSIEKILELADAFLEEPIYEIMDYIDVDYFHKVLFKYTSKKYKQFSKQLADVPIDETTLEEFVFSKLNSDYNEDKSIALGIFTGALAHILTERNKAQGKRTRIYINGHGGRFDNLFYGAHDVDEVFVHNLKGNYICGYVHKASRLVGVSLYGKGIFNNCGLVRKKTKTKQVQELVAIGINGDYHLHHLNNINHLIAVGLNGEKSTIHIVDNCYIKRIVGFNINETSILMGDGSCDEILLVGAKVGYRHQISSIKKKKFVHYNDIPFTIGAQLYQIFYNGSAEEYRQHKEALDADKLAEHLKDRPREEVIKIVDEVTRYADELSQRLLVK